MAEFGPQETNQTRPRPAPEQANTAAPSYDRSTAGTSRPYHRNTTQKFKSYRDSDSDQGSEIDSEEERHLFGHPRKPSGFPEASNAWIQKGKSEVHSPRSADTESVTSSTCSCDHVENIWIRRSESKGSKSSGTCVSCSRARAAKSSEKNAVNKPMVKSRRDSTDSPISSPSFRRVFRKSSSRERKNSEFSDPSKRGVKVTSL